MALSPEQISERAAAAQTLLDNATLSAVFEEMLAKGYGSWLATTSSEVIKREKFHARVRAIQALREELKERVDAAKKQEADEKRREQRKKEI